MTDCFVAVITGLVTTGLIANENEHLNKSGLAKERQEDAAIVEICGSIINGIPNFSFPNFSWSIGGSNLGAAINAWARGINSIAAGYTYESTTASVTGSNIRRADDWAHQQKLAAKELQQIDKQILASQIREDISTKELSNQEQQIENAQLTEEFFRNKFTNQELFGWMIGEMATCFFPYYQLVYAWAKAAERCYRFELGIPNTNFISFGYWDSFRKGLMAGEKLQLALKQMEQSYIECNKREYELTKHISLLQTNPLALLALKETGTCIIELPESLFDMDYPGQFMRKIKSVSISIPCVVGPYTSINCTLTLLKSKLRMKNILQAGTYAEQEEDDRFETRSSATNAIATSHAQNDPGMFELNFRDERFLPFEGAGAISFWKINMPIENNQFNMDTVSDLILHLKYTAREGGKILVDAARNEIKINNKFGNRLFSLKHDFPNEWYAFLNPVAPNTDQVLSINLDGDRFSYLVSSGNFRINQIAVLVDSAAASIPVLSVTSPGNTSKPYTFSKVPVKYGPLFTGHASTEFTGELPGIWKLINPSTNAIKITKDNCNDIMIVVGYERS